MLLLVDASRLCTKYAACLEVLEVDDAHKSEYQFKAWMEVMKTLAANKERKNEIN